MVDFAALESQYGLPSGLLQAQMQQESGGNPNAVSSAGAQGPFQFMPATAQQYGVSNPFDIEQAAPAAAKMNSDLLNKYNGNLPMALAGYNWGQGNLDRNGLQNAPAETQNYITSITSKLPQQQPDPSQMSDEQIKAELAQTQSAQPVPSAMSDADLMNELKGQQTPQSNPDFFQRTANDLSARNQNQQAINQADYSGQGGQSVQETMMQTLGNQMGKYIGDPFMNAAGSLARSISPGAILPGMSLPTQTPQGAPSNLMDLFQQGLGSLKDAVSPYLNPGIQQGANYVQSNPNLSRDVNAMGDIAMAAPLAKPLVEGIGSIGSLVKDALPEKAAVEAVPKSAEYLKESGDNYNEMKDLNLSMGDDSQKVVPSIMKSLDDSNVTLANAPQTMNVIKDLQDQIETNGDIKLHELEDVKQSLNQIYGGPDGVAANAAKSGVQDFFDEWKNKDPATVMQSAQGELSDATQEWGKLKNLEQTLTDSVSDKGQLASQSQGEVRQQHINNAADEAKGLNSVRKQIKAQEGKISDLKDKIANTPDDEERRAVGANLQDRASKLWATGKKLQDMEKIRAQATLSKNPGQTIKTKLGQTVINPKRSRGYTSGEKATMFNAAKPNPIKNTIGHLASSRLLPLALLAHGDVPAALGAGAMNELTRVLAKRAGTKSLDNLSQMIVKNRPIPARINP